MSQIARLEELLSRVQRNRLHIAENSEKQAEPADVLEEPLEADFPVKEESAPIPLTSKVAENKVAAVEEDDFSDLSAPTAVEEDDFSDLSAPTAVEEDDFSDLSAPSTSTPLAPKPAVSATAIARPKDPAPSRVTVEREEPVIEISTQKSGTLPKTRTVEAELTATGPIAVIPQPLDQPAQWTIGAILTRAWNLGGQE